jgi:hypothetical protein
MKRAEHVDEVVLHGHSVVLLTTSFEVEYVVNVDRILSHIGRADVGGMITGCLDAFVVAWLQIFTRVRL